MKRRASSSRVLAHAALVVTAFACAASGHLHGAEPAPSNRKSSAALRPYYPGLRPGPARITVEGERIAAGNAALSLAWSVTPQGLRLRSIKEEQGQRTVAFEGELFAIAVDGDSRYAASALTPEGPPRVSPLIPDAKAARLGARIGGRVVEASLRSADGRLRVVWRAIAPDEANYVRQEIAVSAVSADAVVREIVWMDGPLADARLIGEVDGSPIAAGNFFLGPEDPHGQSGKQPGRAVCRLRRDAPLRKGEMLTLSFVIGSAPAGQLRRGFLYYLEHERAHPYRPFLHYNSWYDTAWQPFALNEANCLEAIKIVGERFVRPHQVVMDAMVFDDGWDDPKTLWQFHRGFPNGFAPLAEECRRYDTRLGVWLSPFGGYGQPREERLKFGRQQGYEINATGFSLAGPRYYAAFKDACLGMIRKYGVNHFKFDGIAAGMYASGGAEYILDTEAMRRLMLELRQEDPALFINLTTGSWPSPFWLRYADSLWRQGGDMGLAGKGSRQQQWLTYRDQEVFRNIVRKAPLYPLNALMTQGVAYSRQGTAGDPTFNSAGFKDDVRAFFGAGTGLQELYIQPGKLTDEDWRVLAEAAKWSRANADVLVDTHWIGGDPSKAEVYGYASWSPRRGVVLLRNPSEQPADFALDLGTAFELPPGAATRYSLKSPWSDDAARTARPAEAGKPLGLRLAPFEVMVFDAIPSVE